MRTKGAARAVSLCLLTLAVACSDPAAPSERAAVHVYAGDRQYGTPGSLLEQPIEVIVLDGARRPRSGVTVRWRVTRGPGAVLTSTTATTGSDGLARVNLRLGQDTGRYEVQASVERMTGEPAKFQLRSVLRPVVNEVTPRRLEIPDTLTVTGQNFSAVPEENIAWFDGLRGEVVTATPSQLRVVVPPCMPTRTATVRVALGAVESNGIAVDVIGSDDALLSLQPGEAVRISNGQEMACQRLPAAEGAAYVVIPQNISAVAGTLTPFLLGSHVRSDFAVASAPAAPRPAGDFASRWEARLRTAERAFPRTTSDVITRYQMTAVADPAIGDRRRFKVLNRNNRFSDVDAEVKHVSDRAIIYVDRNAPQNGFTTGDLEQIGSTFDSMIWPVDVQHFGNPSDIDGNGKVIMLMTPVVNELTPAGSSSFIGGFFYACDLMSKNDCAGSNGGEVFYLLVPDPMGHHGNIRSRQTVLSAVLPILAHEFQHMIHYAVRGRLDALWLSEGLAHVAEDLVADAYAQAGDSATARQYRLANYNRAVRFLGDTTTSLVSEELPGSVEQRGAAWLLLKYLQGHHGNDLLRTLTASQRSSADNVSDAVGKPWTELLSDWAVALWADDAPGIGATVDARHTFPNIDLRRDLTGGAYPLRFTSATFADFGVTGALRPSSQRYFYFDAQAASTPLTLALTSPLGAAFGAEASVQLTIFRVK